MSDALVVLIYASRTRDGVCWLLVSLESDLQEYQCLADWTMKFQHSRLPLKNFIFEISFSVLKFSNQRNIKVITLLLIFIAFDDSDFSSSGKLN